MLAAALAISLGQSYDFPEAPIQSEVDRGGQIYRKHKGIEKIYLDSRVVIGKWFDGLFKRDIEEAIWLSPNLMSRWLGYLSTKERWQSDELDRRWYVIRKSLEGKASFVVHLSAFPKMGYEDLEAIPMNRADEDGLHKLRFALYDHGNELPSTSLVLDRRDSSVPSELEHFKWYLALPLGEQLRGEFECPDGTCTSIGDYHAAWFFVQAPAPLGRGEVDLTVYDQRKERHAVFNRVDKPKPSPVSAQLPSPRSVPIRPPSR